MVGDIHQRPWFWRTRYVAVGWRPSRLICSALEDGARPARQRRRKVRGRASVVPSPPSCRLSNTQGVDWYPPEPGLEAEGVILRPFQVKDAAALVAACRDAAILRFTFMQDGLTEAGAVEWIIRSNERWLNGYPRFAIVHPDDDRLLGQVGLNVNVQHLSAEGHYWMKASDRQRGVASSALGLVADWGFSKGIQRLFLLIHPENVASNRLAQRMGFTREGVLRSYEPVKDQRPDLVSWSLLPGDPRPWH